MRFHRDGLFDDLGLVPRPGAPTVSALFCLRSDPSGMATTTLLDNRRLVQTLSPRDRALLRETPLHFRKENRGGGPFNGGTPEQFGHVRRFAHPAVVGPPDDPQVELNSFRVDAAKTERGEAASEAWERLIEASTKLADDPATDRVLLRPGNLLLMLNFRVTHGRSPYTATWDGQDREQVRRVPRAPSARLKRTEGAGPRKGRGHNQMLCIGNIRL